MPRQHQQKRRLGETGRRRIQLGRPIVSGDEAEAGGIHGAGLAGHGVGKTLTLESGGQVHFAAGKEAGKKLHHHLLSVAQTGRLRLMEWGSSFAGGDIGSLQQKLNRKSEALDMKCDTVCDIFRQDA
jgi:hypothetical protein